MYTEGEREPLNSDTLKTCEPLMITRHVVPEAAGHDRLAILGMFRI